MNKPYTQVDLLRHGEVATPGLFCAPADEPLSKQGWQQLEQAVRQGRWDQMISSPAVRCACFARQWAREQAAPLHIEHGFREMHFGRWTGLPHAQVWERHREQLLALWQAPETFTAPEGEPMQDFIQRVQTAWHDLLQNYSGQSVLLLTHAGVMRVILALVCGLSPAQAQVFQLQYAHFTRVRVYPDPAGDVYSLIAHGVPAVEL